MAQLGSLIVTGDARFLNTIYANISGTAANVRGTVAVANGGTGATTAAAALTSLGAAASGHTHGISIAADSGTNQLTMAANTKYKITAGGQSYIFTTPPDNNTNNAVTQTATTTSANYEILFSVTADNTTRTEGARKNSNLLFNPSTGNLQATQLNGVTIGSSPKFTDNNTTYTFANGTNGFTVTPSGGSAQTVTVTPSIANNITGSGTSGYLTKFNGANTVTNGPALGSSTSTYLRNDGTWQTPPNTDTKMSKKRYTITATSWSNSADANGYYTYTVTLSSPTLATSYPPNVYIAGSTDTTFPTDTEKEQYALLEQCNHTATNSLTLYAKTKPTSNFYVYIEGQST